MPLENINFPLAEQVVREPLLFGTIEETAQFCFLVMRENGIEVPKCPEEAKELLNSLIQSSREN